MLITHCNNTAGVPSTLAKYQSLLGKPARVLVRTSHPFRYGYEQYASLHSGFLKLLASDIVHYHYSSWYTSLLRVRNFDAKFLSRIGKLTVMHYHGDDLRLGKPIDARFRKIFVSTRDLLEYLPDAEFLPNPIEVEAFKPEPERNPPHLIGYSMSTYDIRRFSPPPEEVHAVVKSLRRKGLSVAEAPLTPRPFHAMRDYLASLTVWIDKIRGNFYGKTACESSLVGRAVIAGNCDAPFFQHSGNLRADLEYLIEDEDSRRDLVGKARQYVLRNHDPIEIAKRTIIAYESLRK